ncbi:copper chaperone [Oikeobacillus pervagus]|uniref:Copper chaperone CopZ n=1 Tax=Oikeobacillus pervagus TaxID=1325931 RepID=A0AAJ1T3Z7_9BACI|nr:copper chaperone CopZ [Oikeobacillus pervagus]MDQ0214415.1 copper chaperone [Oikeobacillus pervagus]
MEKVTFNVKGMTCGHCEKAVKGALQEVEGVTEVQVQLSTGTVVVNYEANASVEKMKETIEDQGYDVQ